MRNDVPFFFVDNGHILVLTMWAEGQRRSNAYHFYQMDADGKCIQDDLYQITNQEPYNQIDELSTINDNEIVISQTGGAYYHVDKIYRRESNSYNSYTLDLIKEYVEDSIYIYEIQRRLLRKECKRQ